MEAKCQAMMAGHDKMMADMNAADARLGPKAGPPAPLTLLERIALGRSIAARLSR